MKKLKSYTKLSIKYKFIQIIYKHPKVIENFKKL